MDYMRMVVACYDMPCEALNILAPNSCLRRAVFASSMRLPKRVSEYFQKNLENQLRDNLYYCY